MLTEEEMELFEIAFLLRMPVYQLMDMPYDELVGWQYYLSKRPPEWRDDYRTSLMLKASGVKADSNKLFPSLKAIHQANNNTLMSSLKQSSFFQKMSKAKGGDQIL